MKRCPKCEFSFPDFHRVCDFDGAALLDDPERPPTFMERHSARTRFRRVLKSPFFVDGLAGVVLLASAVMIGYYNSRSDSKSIATDQPSQNAFLSPVSSTEDSTEPAIQPEEEVNATGARVTSTRAVVQSISKKREKSASPAGLGGNLRLSNGEQMMAARELARLQSPTSAGTQPLKPLVARPITASPQLARLHSPPGPAGNQPLKSLVARQAEREQAANPKEPKLVAMLKTTWRVLKRPFKF